MRRMLDAVSRTPALSLLCALALAAAAAESFAGERTARFRAGTVVSAEISSTKPEVLDESPYEPYKDTKGLAWAEVVVKLDKGRSLGVADYVLVHSGNEYKCLAIAEDDKVYSVRDWTFDKTNIFGSYRLLFPIQFPQSNKNDFELRFKLLPSPMPDIPIKVRHMDAAPFPETSKLPPDGALGLSAAEMRAAKKAASASAPSAAAPAPAPADASKK